MGYDWYHLEILHEGKWTTISVSDRESVIDSIKWLSIPDGTQMRLRGRSIMEPERAPTKWEARYFLLAHHVATWSKDPTTQVGAVVFGADPREHCFGYNGFPPGLSDALELYDDRKMKYRRVQHAERNALDNARFSCVGGTLATTMFPCIECAKSIISKGIRKVITPRPPKPIAEPSWRDDCAYSVDMFREVGIEIVWMPDSLP